MIISVQSFMYKRPWDGQRITVKVGGKFVDWQEICHNNITSINIFAGTGACIRFDNEPEIWVHWGKLLTWQEREQGGARKA